MVQAEINAPMTGSTKKKMPKSVIVTTVALGIYIAFSLALQVMMTLNGQKPFAVIGLSIFLVLLIMFATGMRLGRPILLFFVCISLFGVLAAIIMPAVRSGSFSMRSFLILLAIASPLVTAFIAILQRSAKEYSGYFCPTCGSGDIKALDFMYNKAQCRACGNIWN